MNKSEKLLKILSSLIENGILNSRDIQKEVSTDLKFKRDKIILGAGLRDTINYL